MDRIEGLPASCLLDAATIAYTIHQINQDLRTGNFRYKSRMFSKNTKEVIDESELDAAIESDLAKFAKSLPLEEDNPTAGHYVDNKKLHEEMKIHIYKLRECKAAGLPLPRVPEYIGKCILLMNQRMATRPNFAGYPFRDEMIGDGVENCLKYLHNYDPDKYANPFGYFSRYIWNTFVRRILTEKHNSAIKAKKLASMGLDENAFETQEQDDDGDFHNTFIEHMQQSSDFLSSYEEKLAEKRESRRKRRAPKALENFLDDDSVFHERNHALDDYNEGQRDE